MEESYRWNIQTAARMLDTTTAEIRRLVAQGILTDLRPPRQRRSNTRIYVDPQEVKLYAAADWSGLESYKRKMKRLS